MRDPRGIGWLGRRASGVGQQRVDFFVGGGAEGVVPQANGGERVRRGRADKLVHLLGEIGTGFAGRNGDGGDEARGALGAQGGNSGAHGGAGGQAVIHENDDTAVYIGRRSAVSVDALATNQFL